MLDSRTDSNMDALLILKDMEERIRQEDCFGWDLYDALLSKWFKKGRFWIINTPDMYGARLTSAFHLIYAR